MSHHVTVLDFDETYDAQASLKGEGFDWLELGSIPNTSLFCEKTSLKEISKQLEYYKQNKVTLLGNGNYHYVTYAILSKMKTPFTLILFDHHTDMGKSPAENLLSCGSWVHEALKTLPFLEKVVIIGVSDDYEYYNLTNIHQHAFVLTEHDLHLHSNHYKTLLKQIPTEAIYISIDKDVLSEEDAVTAWDQGSMKLKQLASYIHVLLNEKDVLGIDICGEYPFSPEERFFETVVEAVKKNEYANQYLLNHILN